MNPVTLHSLARWSGGALIQGVPSERVAGVSTDTRTLGPGQVFVALKGENHDAHDFLGQAGDKGASAIVVQRLGEDSILFPGGIVHVRDTLSALQEMARNYRRSLRDFFALGVTGSNGKTSTKDFLRAVLAREAPVNATAGNLNNHIGLPLTILRTGGEHRSGVWEMGMNHPGEIEILAEIARPDAAVITMVGTAHIEFMKTREAIAAEKTELALAVPPEGFCAMPARDDFYEYVRERVACRMVPVGIGTGEIVAEEIAVGDEDGAVSFRFSRGGGEWQRVRLPVGGRHMVNNALLAAAAGFERGIAAADIAEALETAELTGGRLQVREAGGLRFLDDSYNANPDSMRAALAALVEHPCGGRRFAVLGLMGELGDCEESAHLALGESVARSGIDCLLTVGDTAALIAEGARAAGETRDLRVERFGTHAGAAAFIRAEAGPGDLVLVKGSRAARMEETIRELEALEEAGASESSREAGAPGPAEN